MKSERFQFADGNRFKFSYRKSYKMVSSIKSDLIDDIIWYDFLIMKSIQKIFNFDWW